MNVKIDKLYTKDLYCSWLKTFKGNTIKQIIDMDFATEIFGSFYYDQAEIVDMYLVKNELGE